MSARKIVLLIVLLPWCCFSQNRATIPLKAILDQIAQQHQINFSYIDEELVVYMLVPPDDNLTLSDKLLFIEKRTRLKFTKVAENYYTVSNDQRMDKPLCGFLRDAETSQGIENAEIHITGTAVSVASNHDGYFELPIFSPNDIEIRHQGYKTTSISPQHLYTADCSEILVHSVTATLDEVITQRYLTTGITKAKFGELIVRPDKFGMLPGLTEPDILQTLQQVPGITSIDETISNLNVRGGTHDQNLFLWNGIRMFQTGHFFGLISAFNPLQPTKITVYKNGSPSAFGESVSSVVSISTHTTLAQKSQHAVSVDWLNGNILSKIKLSERSAVQLSARRSYADVFETPTYQQYENRIFQNTIVTVNNTGEQVPIESTSNFHFYDFSLQYQHKIGTKHELIADGLGIGNNFSISQRTETRGRYSRLTQQSLGSSIQWKSTWSDKSRSLLQLYGSSYDLDAINESVQNNQIVDQRNRVFDKGFRFHHTYIRALGTYELGYQFNEISVANDDIITEPSFRQFNKDVLLTHVVFGQYHYRNKNERTQFRLGLRANYFEKYSRIVVEPRLSIMRKLSRAITVDLSGELKSQTLSQIIDQQQDFLGIEKRRWALADEEDFPIQQSAQASVGFTFLNNGWLITFESYYKNITGVSSAAQGFQNQFEFDDTAGTNQVLGSELLFQKIFKDFSTWISYGFTDSNYNFNTYSPTNFASNFEIRHSISFAATYAYRNFQIAAGSKWHTGRPFTEANAVSIDRDNSANSSIEYGAPNTSELKPYWQVNFSAAKKWKFGNNNELSLNAAILNLLNRNNVINRYYRINADNTNFETVNTFSLGITPNLSLKVVF